IMQNHYDVVIAHRGTNNWKALSEDIEMFLTHTMPSQFNNSVIPFVTYAIEYLNNKYGKLSYSITFTGHSLGASLAEFGFTKFFDSTFTNLMVEIVINFESPGTKLFIEQMINDGLLPKDALANLKEFLVTSNSDVNAINSCFEHVNQQDLTPDYVGYSYLQ